MSGSQVAVKEEITWSPICKTDDIPFGVGVGALINGHQVAIFKIPGKNEFAAIDNYCPFANANVLSRGIVGDLKGKVVDASPIYKQHYDLATGNCLEDENVKLNVFSVRVNDGMIEVAA